MAFGALSQRYPGQVILKSTRLRVSHSRRRDRGRGSDGGDEQEPSATGGSARGRSPPLLLSTSVQTEPSSTLTTQPLASRLPAAQPPLPAPNLADSSCSPCSLSSLLGSPVSPPPPPPPPPPLPPKEELSPGSSSGCGGTSIQIQGAEVRSTAAAAKEEPATLSPLGPFIPRFFDSSQLMSARKRLRKTPEFSSHGRRGNIVKWMRSATGQFIILFRVFQNS